MDDNTPTAIPWWQSRTLWTQLVAIAFAVASGFGLDLGGKLGMDETQALAGVMTIIAAITVVWRVFYPNPQVTSDKATATHINRIASMPAPSRSYDPPAASGSSSGGSASKLQASSTLGSTESSSKAKSSPRRKR